MKKIILSLALGLSIFTSCTTSVVLIGNHEVISNQSIDLKKEVQTSLKSQNLDFETIKKKENRSEYVIDAVDKAVSRDTSGKGIYVANAKVYMIHKTNALGGWKAWFYVDGDIVRYK